MNIFRYLTMLSIIILTLTACQTSKPEIFDTILISSPVNQNAILFKSPLSTVEDTTFDNDLFSLVVKMQVYLSENIDPKDYGSLAYDFSSITIGYINHENVKKVVANYTGTPVDIIYTEARYSVSDLKWIADDLKSKPIIRNYTKDISVFVNINGRVTINTDSPYQELVDWLKTYPYKNDVDYYNAEKINPLTSLEPAVGEQSGKTPVPPLETSSIREKKKYVYKS